ncbi:helix-turn-helix transcriptional regulator [Streptomyces sp. SID8499]|uniref:helix-turn-helix domain-containing protein n=1 Tax=Streptomyces sp. SID8499 TaxID=2706106 RepID=UPI0013C6E5A6|nr:helix-turn-helix transcriptional regulator [Streptomyces sp. SID8499]NED32241.1 helix-turn-helix domain-containing protein [Streptomyces sp. SID8499]
MTAPAFGLPPEKREVCADLRDEAAQSGLSYREIARQAHASPAAVSLVMNGHRWPSPRMFEAIVRAMTGKERGGHLAEKYNKAVAKAALVLLVLLAAASGITGRVASAPDCPHGESHCAIVDGGRSTSREEFLIARSPQGIPVYAGPYDRVPVRYIHHKVSVTPLCGANVMSGLTDRYLVASGDDTFWVDKANFRDGPIGLQPECGQ